MEHFIQAYEACKNNQALNESLIKSLNEAQIKTLIEICEKDKKDMSKASLCPCPNKIINFCKKYKCTFPRPVYEVNGVIISSDYFKEMIFCYDFNNMDGQGIKFIIDDEGETGSIDVLYDITCEQLFNDVFSQLHVSTDIMFMGKDKDFILNTSNILMLQFIYSSHKMQIFMNDGWMNIIGKMHEDIYLPNIMEDIYGVFSKNEKYIAYTEQFEDVPKRTDIIVLNVDIFKDFKYIHEIKNKTFIKDVVEASSANQLKK